MITQIQIKYKNQETELIKFQNEKSAIKFLASVIKNPDVASAKKL